MLSPLAPENNEQNFKICAYQTSNEKRTVWRIDGLEGHQRALFVETNGLSPMLRGTIVLDGVGSGRFSVAASLVTSWSPDSCVDGTTSAAQRSTGTAEFQKSDGAADGDARGVHIGGRARNERA